MMEKIFIVIEGIADQVFLVDLITHLLYSTHKISFDEKAKSNDKGNLVVNIATVDDANHSYQITFLKVNTNGKSIKSQKIQEIRTATDSLRFKTIFILDADAPNFNETRETLRENFRSEEIQLEETNIFLLPNNSNDGCLENLLEQIVGPQSGAVFGCFDAYRACIERVNSEYTKPDLKTKIYAYSEIITNSGSERTRNYRDESVWNLNHVVLSPLIDFLKTHLS